MSAILSPPLKTVFSALSPRRKLVYRCSQIGMTALPVIFSLAGILLCGLTFYRRKLKTPISLLASASQKIAGQNLDFQISCGSRDEMGMLCDSFEKMRQTLKENYQKLWRIVEERRELQGSVAHDLRNPIAIIQGYAQYLQFHLTKEQINREKVLSAADHIMQTAQRLDRYTESLRTISRLEELEIRPRPVSFFPTLGQNVRRSFSADRKRTSGTELEEYRVRTGSLSGCQNTLPNS